MATIGAYRLLVSVARRTTRGPTPGLLFNARRPSVDKPTAPFSITSSAFAAGASIPSAYTCEGRNTSPPLAWSGVPLAAKSLALVMDDPDAPDPAAPKRVFVHWVLYDLPPTSTGLPPAVNSRALPAGTREGTNDWNRAGYGGPCPPVGRHRYFFKLYALDVVLPDLHGPTKRQLEAAMAGHVLAQAEVIGTYQKQG
jgi:Raf kinase inhibitor-like YbhB/YbcL family protein